MLKKLFNKNKEVPKVIDMQAYATGNIVKLEDAPDPVFSEKMMGDGIAIEPIEGIVLSPVDGEVIQIFPTKHAFGIKAHNGVEILIHIGLETVSMNGDGFTAHVTAGQKIQKGHVLVSFDLDLVKKKQQALLHH